MIRVHKATRKVDGKTVHTRVREIVSANMIDVEVGTNGFRGGDAGHGSRTYFSIRDEGGTAMKCEAVGDCQSVEIQDCEEITIILSGDTELATFLEALRFAVKTLEGQVNPKKLRGMV